MPSKIPGCSVSSPIAPGADTASSSSAAVEMKIPDLNKKTMTILSSNGLSETGPLETGPDGFAICKLSRGTIATEIPNLALTGIQPKAKRKAAMKRPAAMEAAIAKKTKTEATAVGNMYNSEDEGSAHGTSDNASSDQEMAIAVKMPSASATAITAVAKVDSAAEVVDAVVAHPADVPDVEHPVDADPVGAEHPADVPVDPPDVPQNELKNGQMWYKNTRAIGIRVKPKGKEIIQFGDKTGKVLEKELRDIGNVCRQKLHRGLSITDAKEWAKARVSEIAASR